MRHAQQIVQPRRRRLDPALVRQSLRDAAHDEQRAQRHDEGHDLQLRDQDTVDQAADRRRRHRAERGEHTG